MKTVRLGDVAEINPRADKLPADREVSFVGMNELNAERACAVPREIRPYSEVSQGYTAFRNGDILAAKITPCWENGKVGAAELSTENGCGSTEFHVLRSGSELDSRYLLHFLRQPNIRLTGEIRMTGSGGQRRVPKAYLSDLQIPLPPLDEQRRIAGILDSVSRRIDDNNVLVNRYERLLTGLVGRFQEGADLVPLADLGEIQGGLQVTSKRADHPISAPYLRVANVFRGRIDTTEIKTMWVTERELGRVSLVMGDILFVEGHGNPDEVGRCAVWESQGQGVIHQNHLIRFRPNQSVALPDYVSAACNALRGRDSLQGLARTTSGLNTISTKDVKSLKIPLASMDRQRSFSVAAQRIKGINRQIALRRATLEELRSALQYRAFRGEL